MQVFFKKNFELFCVCGDFSRQEDVPAACRCVLGKKDGFFH